MEMMLYGVVCKNRYKKAEASLALFFFFVDNKGKYINI